MIRPTLLSLILACAIGGASAQDQAPLQDLPDFSTISESHVTVADVSNPNQPGKTFIAATAIRSPVKTLCAILTDYSAYPQFMPNTAKTSVLNATDAAALIEMTLQLPLGKIKRYRLNMLARMSQDSCLLSWKLAPWEGLSETETIADTSGYWLLSTDPVDPERTLVKYYVFADPGPVPFGFGWIVNLMSRVSLPRTLEALRDRVNQKTNTLTYAPRTALKQPG